MVSLPGGFTFQWLDFSRETELFGGTLTIPLITTAATLDWSDNNVASQLKTNVLYSGTGTNHLVLIINSITNKSYTPTEPNNATSSFQYMIYISYSVDLIQRV